MFGRIADFGLLCLLLHSPTVSWGATAESGSSQLETERATNRSLLWGPYKPNLYLGIRPRIPKSLSASLLWSRVEDYKAPEENFRHTCEQHNSIHGYGWDSYDPRTGGVQTIHDNGNGIQLKTTFVKQPEAGAHGGHWAIRVSGTPAGEAQEDFKTTVVFALTLEGLGNVQVVGDAARSENGASGNVEFEGETVELGKFKIVVGDNGGKNKHPLHGHASAQQKPLDLTFIRSGAVRDEDLWQGKAILFEYMKEQVQEYVERYTQENLPPPEQFFTLQHHPGQGNVHLVQKVFEGPFQFDILYSSASAAEPMTSESLSRLAGQNLRYFEERYREILRPQAPFSGEKYARFSKSLFSNLIGGIGYFYGDQRIDRSYADEYLEESEGFWDEAAEARGRAEIQLEGPSELFTSIPSRPFFPRGFLWDEGFHLIPILDWDSELVMQIVQSWFNLADEDGWIPREVILGLEARSKVPSEFQVQYPHYANPPTLFLIPSMLIDKLETKNGATSAGLGSLGEREVLRDALRQVYPLLKRHYEWWRRTQKGDIKTYDRNPYSSREGYRWRGRTPQHILPSGLDDFPRAQPPHPGELHVDAMSWVGMMTKSLKRVAAFLGETDDVNEFSVHEIGIVRNLDDLHWDEKQKMYCDTTIDDFEEDVHACHKGYISLFPFMTGLVDHNGKQMAHVLDLIADPEHLWSRHGIRSLSKSSDFYGTDENYWRSPVWMNMNYLIILRLLEIAQGDGPHQKRALKLYTDLRKNLVDTVLKSWEETGFAWEQYDPDSGNGQRTQHFTGWTSLVVKIMAMPDLVNSPVKDEL